MCFRKTSAFHDIPRQLHSNVMKEQQDGKGPHTHNILRINWPVLLTCRNDGNAKVYVYNTNTMKKSNITRALFQFRFLLEYMDGWMDIYSLRGNEKKKGRGKRTEELRKKMSVLVPHPVPFLYSTRSSSAVWISSNIHFNRIIHLRGMAKGIRNTRENRQMYSGMKKKEPQICSSYT